MDNGSTSKSEISLGVIATPIIVIVIWHLILFLLIKMSIPVNFTFGGYGVFLYWGTTIVLFSTSFCVGNIVRPSVNNVWTSVCFSLPSGIFYIFAFCLVNLGLALSDFRNLDIWLFIQIYICFVPPFIIVHTLAQASMGLLGVKLSAQRIDSR